MTTARQLIQSSLRLSGVLMKSEPMTADEAQDALTALNQMIQSWANDSLLIFSRTWQDFPVTPGTLEYTIGVGGTWNTQRPTQIISAYFRQDGNNVDYPLEQLTDDQYALYIGQKNLQSNIPQYFNFDNGWPLAKIRLWQVPSTGGRVHMQNEAQVTSFPTLDTVINLPPGWEKALRYNLALELAPEYDVQPSPLVVQGAKESKGTLQQQALKNRPLTFMPSVLGYGYNIYGDTWYR